MFATLMIFASLAFAESKALAVQICLDREGYSCNTIDGQWGGKSASALRDFLRARGDARTLRAPLTNADTPNWVYDRYFSGIKRLFRIEEVTQADLNALVKIPEAAADKAKLDRLGYESIQEMFAERGHLSLRALERMNPGVDWSDVKPGLKLVIPDFTGIDEQLAARNKRPPRKSAVQIRVSLSGCEIRVCDTNGACIAHFPCSIARDKSKRPPHGELKVVSLIPWPNYTYAPDFVPAGKKAGKHILMDGPNNPVGVVWIGLNLPSYGIHGTPRPESIGNAESHGCFRLSNWNAARLYSLCTVGTKVIIEP